MGQIKIQESELDLTQERKGKIAVITYLGEDDPVETLNQAVYTYTQGKMYSEFIDINMDNPWTRVIMSHINDMEQENFDPTTHRL